jgi:hypothetical protein
MFVQIHVIVFAMSLKVVKAGENLFVAAQTALQG